MKIGFFNPYLNSLGGGERYVCTLADHWSTMHDVCIFWHDREIIPLAEKRFHVQLHNVTVVSDYKPNMPFLKRQALLSGYDLVFIVSDGSIPFPFAPRNILLFQAPFARISYPWWKRVRHTQTVVYSAFVKEHIDSVIGKYAKVIAPPVDTQAMVPKTKTHTILSVGRFSASYEAKKHDVLIQAFQRGYKEGLFSSWQLIIAGGLLDEDIGYFQILKKLTKGFPITLIPNCSFDMLQKLYGEAACYWHAAGYGETDPTKMEHFGITTVEAMAAGCIPVVYAAGGQPEIVSDGKSGFLWHTPDQLLEKTKAVIGNTQYIRSMKQCVREKALEFDKKVFYTQFDALLK